MNKKVVRTTLICLGIILGLILIENAIRGSVKVAEHVKNNSEIKKEQKAYEASDEYKEDTYVEKCIKSAFEYLKNENYEAIYGMITPEYKDFKQTNGIEELKKQIQDYIGTFDTVSLLDYKTLYERYSCKVAVTTNGKMNVKKVIVTPKNDGNFTIIFDDVDMIISGDKRHNYTDKKIKFNILYEVKYPDCKIYVADVTNISDKLIEGTFEDSSIYRTDKVGYKPSQDSSINVSIAPNETARVNLIFEDINTTSYALDSYMEISLKGKDGKIISKTSISMDEDYYL